MRGAVSTIPLILLLAAGHAAADRVWAPNERAYSAWSDDPHRQFDFWIGEWDVNLRILQDDLTFRDSVAAHASIFPILHGKAILELWDSQPIKGYSLRYYDTQSEQWILWLNWPGKNRSNISSLQGEFRHGRGEFRNEYLNADDETVIVRYAFDDITPFSLRWDDLRSNDGGRTWRKNWRMEFKRTAVEPHWPLDSTAFPTHDTGARCNDERFRPYEKIVGHWHGRINGDTASISSWHVLDGCGVIAFLDIDGKPARKRFMLLTYNTSIDAWETDYLDDDRDTDLVRLTSADNWASMSTGATKLDWSATEKDLIYRFEDGNTGVETGRFERQELEGH